MCLHDLGQLSVCLAQVAVSCISFTPERHQIASWNCSEVLSITCGLTPSFMKHSAFFVLIYGVRAEVASSLLSGQRLWGCLRLSSVAPWATLPWVRVGMTQGTVFTWDSNFCFLTKKMKIHMMTMCEQRVPCTSKGCCRTSEVLCLPEGPWGECAGSWSWPCAHTCEGVCPLFGTFTSQRSQLPVLVPPSRSLLWVTPCSCNGA